MVQNLGSAVNFVACQPALATGRGWHPGFCEALHAGYHGELQDLFISIVVGNGNPDLDLQSRPGFWQGRLVEELVVNPFFRRD